MFADWDCIFEIPTQETSMIELISIVASLFVCIITPFAVREIRGGWVKPRFAGDRRKFLQAYNRQLAGQTLAGVVFGLLFLGLALIETPPGENTLKLIAAAIWFAMAVICFVARRSLQNLTSTTTLSKTSA
jgi:hypothetical protein